MDSLPVSPSVGLLPPCSTDIGIRVDRLESTYWLVSLLLVLGAGNYPYRDPERVPWIWLGGGVGRDGWGVPDGSHLRGAPPVYSGL